MTGCRVCHHRNIAFLSVIEDAPLLRFTSLAVKRSSSLAVKRSTSLAVKQSLSLAVKPSTSLAVKQSSSLAVKRSSNLVVKQSSSLAVKRSSSLAVKQSSSSSLAGFQLSCPPQAYQSPPVNGQTHMKRCCFVTARSIKWSSFCGGCVSVKLLEAIVF